MAKRRLPPTRPPRPIRFDLGRLLPGQAEFWRVLETDEARYVAVVTGIRGGKTMIGARRALREATRRGGLGWIVAPTYTMANTPHRLFEDVLNQHPGMVADQRDHPYPYWRLATAKAPEIEVHTAEYPDRLRGPGLSWVWCDELAIADYEAWRILMGRVLDTGGVIFLTTTPKGRNWVYQEFIGNPSGRHKLITWKTEDNIYLPREEVQELKRRWGPGTVWERQELGGEFVAFEGLVFPEFDPTVHVAEPPKDAQWVEFQAGLDFGHNDPTALVILGKTKQGMWWIVHELYESRLSALEMVRDVAALCRQFHVQRIWADQSRPEFIKEFQRMGAPVLASRPCSPKSLGFPRISVLLKEGTLRVAPHCRNVITEFGLYSYKRKRGTDSVKPGDEVEDRFDHAMDALHYMLWSVAPGSFDSLDWTTADPDEQDRLRLLQLKYQRNPGEPLDRPRPRVVGRYVAD